MKPTDSISIAANRTKVQDISELFKLRLASLVVFSSILGYLIGAEEFSWLTVLLLSLGGFLLTGASNALNQVWERNNDRLMKRTMNRPLPTGRMSVTEAIVYAVIAGVGGIAILWVGLNPLSGILGLLALFSYVFLYTPLKQKSALAVFVGAFPGAIPPMLGYIAATGTFGVEPGALFAMQFMWQFPHFWAIAWVANEDYERAGYRLLPLREGKTKRTAFQIFMYTLFLIPVSMLPWVFPQSAPMIGNISGILTIVCGIIFAWYAWKLYQRCDDQSARALMFASFAYLPVVQILYVLGTL
ncbi:MAG: heme o synthase [Flavobacteriales bacterium]|nr:heme o synthase [Flavobacteriales bacterium]